MQPNLKNNINHLMREHNITISILSDRTGVPESTIKRIKTDDRANPTMTSLIPIAKFFNLTVNQLIGISPLSMKGRAETTIQSIPILTWQQVLTWPEMSNKSITRFIHVDIPLQKNSFALVIEEESIINMTKGSIIIIDHHQKPNHNDYVLVKNVAIQQASLSQYILYDGTEYLKPLIKDIPVKKLNKKGAVIIGKVVQIRLDL